MLQFVYRLALPQHMPQATPDERHRARQARLTSIFALVLSGISILAFPLSAINPPNPVTPYIQGAGMVVVLLAVFTGKLGWQYLSASLVVICPMISVVGTMISNPLDPIFVPSMCVQVIPVILAGALLPPVAALITGTVASGIIVCVHVFAPHTAYYDAQMKLGFYSETVFTPIFAIMVVALVIYIIMRNLNNAILRADRAEEIVKLQEEIASFERERQRSQERLADGVALIAKIHADVANGSLDTRVPLTQLGQNSPLWPVAVPLNNLLSRMERWKLETDRLEQLRAALQALTRELTTARSRRAVPMLTHIDKELDPLKFEIRYLTGQVADPNYTYPPQRTHF